METKNRKLPKISALCITFARPDLLCEAIESFLKQDYLGEKELIILNDFYAQQLSINHPEITVINLPEKVKTLGEKRNKIADLAKGDILFPWDDDDISLRFRVSQSVQYLLKNKVDYYKPSKAFLWNNGVIDSIEAYGFHPQCCYTKSLFNRVRYAAMGCGEDTDFDTKVRIELKQEISTDVSPNKLFYLYRWGGTNSYHISAMDQKNGESLLLEQVTEKLKLKQIPTGSITLKPKWEQNYERQAKEFRERNRMALS